MLLLFLGRLESGCIVDVSGVARELSAHDYVAELTGFADRCSRVTWCHRRVTLFFDDLLAVL